MLESEVKLSQYILERLLARTITSNLLLET